MLIILRGQRVNLTFGKEMLKITGTWLILCFYWCWKKNFPSHFSNSLIIHAEKTKEITTVKEVWICDLNYHKIWWTFALIFSKNYQWFEKLYQTFKWLFHLKSKHPEVGSKNLATPGFFNHFLVFGYRKKHSSSCLIYYLINLLFSDM